MLILILWMTVLVRLTLHVLQEVMTQTALTAKLNLQSVRLGVTSREESMMQHQIHVILLKEVKDAQTRLPVTMIHT